MRKFIVYFIIGAFIYSQAYSYISGFSGGVPKESHPAEFSVIVSSNF